MTNPHCTVQEAQTFGRPSESLLAMLCNDKPYVLNGGVNVRRYRILVEEIEESVEVLAQRLRELLKQPLHMDARQAIVDEARRLNITL